MGEAATWERCHATAVSLTASASVGDNLERILLAITMLDTDLCVFPELAMIDPNCDQAVWDGAAEPIDGPFVAAVRAAAEQAGTAVVVGMAERHDGQVFNTAVAISADGAIAGTYRKLHLFDALGVRESERLTPGDVAGAGVIRVGLRDGSVIPTGVITCYDLRFPELGRLLIDDGVEVLAVPAAWYAGANKLDQWRTLTRARALENTAFVIAADQGPPTFVGDSSVIGPDGALLTPQGGVEVDGGDRSGAVSATLDRAALVAYRRRMPSLEHRRLDHG